MPKTVIDGESTEAWFADEAGDVGYHGKMRYEDRLREPSLKVREQ